MKTKTPEKTRRQAFAELFPHTPTRGKGRPITVAGQRTTEPPPACGPFCPKCADVWCDWVDWCCFIEWLYEAKDAPTGKPTKRKPIYVEQFGNWLFDREAEQV